MVPLTPSFLVATANAFVGVRELERPNCGPMVEIFLRGVNEPAGRPWSAAFVNYVGFWSHYDCRSRRSSWPLPRTASCHALAKYARRRGVLRDEPLYGDVFLLWSVRRVHFAHAGIVAQVRAHGDTPGGAAWFDCDTIEADVIGEASPVHEGVVRRVRRFYPQVGDRFIRWADLDRRRLAA